MPDTLHLVLVFLSLTLNMKLPAGDVKQLVHFVNNAKVVRRPSLDEVHIVVKFCWVSVAKQEGNFNVAVINECCC